MLALVDRAPAGAAAVELGEDLAERLRREPRPKLGPAKFVAGSFCNCDAQNANQPENA